MIYRLTKGCVHCHSLLVLSISVGHCPVYNTVAKKMDSRVCLGKHCPEKVFTSDAVYKCIF